jgi:hypothetical protein
MGTANRYDTPFMVVELFCNRIWRTSAATQYCRVPSPPFWVWGLVNWSLHAGGDYQDATAGTLRSSASLRHGEQCFFHQCGDTGDAAPLHGLTSGDRRRRNHQLGEIWTQVVGFACWKFGAPF